MTKIQEVDSCCSRRRKWSSGAVAWGPHLPEAPTTRSVPDQAIRRVGRVCRDRDQIGTVVWIPLPATADQSDRG